MVFTAASQPFVAYYDALPQKTLETVAQSALFSFSATLFLTSTMNGKVDMTAPLINAAVASLASTIHALMTPLFDKIFNSSQLNWMHEFAKSSVVGFLASSIASYALTSKVDLTAFKFFYLISANSLLTLWMNAPNTPAIKDNSIYLCLGQNFMTI